MALTLWASTSLIILVVCCNYTKGVLQVVVSMSGFAGIALNAYHTLRDVTAQLTAYWGKMKWIAIVRES